MKLALHYAVRSDQGLVRTNNEDSVYAGPRLLAIADGMGGHAGGEVASKIVIGAMEGVDEDRPIDDLITSLREAVQDANESLAAAVANNPGLEGMGTTLTAIRFDETRIGLVHVGDSRAYLLRDGQLTQITHDDTYVQSLVDIGKLTAEEASHHPRKSVILRALNGSDVEPDVAIREVRHHDRYLLCTDGLTDVLRAETLQETLGNGDPQECADALVALALRGGGPDNVTCIVADVVEAGRGDDVPVIAGAVVDPARGSDDDESPAARAAGLGGAREGAAPAAPRRNRRWPQFVVPLAIVAILAAGGLATWFWTQSQYFLAGASDSAGTPMVAVYRGVDTRIGPVRFYRVVSRSDLRVIDLKPSARSQIQDGITANSRSDASTILNRLKTGELLPLCVPAAAVRTTVAVVPAPTKVSATRPASTAPATTRKVPLTTRRLAVKPTAKLTVRPTVTLVKRTIAPIATPTVPPPTAPTVLPPVTSTPASTTSADPNDPTCRIAR